jgi:hypothetical protein
MKQLLFRLLATCATAGILLLASPFTSLCQGSDESGILPCIPDLEPARQALVERRGARFIAYLRQIADRYIRNRDYHCLYDLLKFFDETSLSNREARTMLLYRMVAQLGRKNPIGATMDYGWLTGLEASEDDHEFDTLMENKLSAVCKDTVAEFVRAIDLLKYRTTRNQMVNNEPSWGGKRWRPFLKIVSFLKSEPLFCPQETVLTYLVSFSAQRLANSDYLTLERCCNAISAYELNPAERHYLYSIQTIVNLRLGHVSAAHDVYRQRAELEERFPDKTIEEQIKTQSLPLHIMDGFTKHFTIDDERLQSEFRRICDKSIGHCGISMPVPDCGALVDPEKKSERRAFEADVLTTVVRLETKALARQQCDGAWLCLKLTLDPIVGSDAVCVPVSPDKERLLFLLAKVNMRLNDFQMAYRQFQGVKNSASFKEIPYAGAIDGMIKTCSEMIRNQQEGSLKDKLVDMSEIFYHTARDRFIAVSVVVFLSLFFFIHWHLLFTRRRSASMSLIRTFAKIPRLTRPSNRLFFYLFKSRKPRPMRCVVFEEKEINLELHSGVGALAGESHDPPVSLAVRSREMVRQLSLQAPYPICMIARLPGYRPRLHFWYYTACGAIVSLLATWVFSYGKPMPPGDKALIFFLLTATIVAALTGIRIMTRQVLRCLREIATMLENKDDLLEVEKGALVMFRDPWQFFVALVIYGLFFTLASNQLPSGHVAVVMIILILCPIHWMMIGSLLFTRVLCDMHNLSMNPLSPLKTWGLQKWIAVIGTFATTGSVIITFSSAIPIMNNWENLAGRDLFWIFTMLPLLLAYWIYPYFRIRSLVRRYKLARMHFVKTHISQAYDSWQSLAAAAIDTKTIDADQLKNIESQMDRLNRYYGLFKVIDQSPEFFVDIYSILELAKVMGIPSLFALVAALMRLL